jgi:hypothetical protein
VVVDNMNRRVESVFRGESGPHKDAGAGNLCRGREAAASLSLRADRASARAAEGPTRSDFLLPIAFSQNASRWSPFFAPENGALVGMTKKELRMCNGCICRAESHVALCPFCSSGAARRTPDEPVEHLAFPASDSSVPAILATLPCCSRFYVISTVPSVISAEAERSRAARRDSA